MFRLGREAEATLTLTRSRSHHSVALVDLILSPPPIDPLWLGGAQATLGYLMLERLASIISSR